MNDILDIFHPGGGTPNIVNIGGTNEQDGTITNVNRSESIVTTSVFVVMILIFIGVLLIACCKVLIGCTARNFLGSRRNANMVYAINNNILGGNSNSRGDRNTNTNQAFDAAPPCYDELSVYSLPPSYQFNFAKSSSEKDNSDTSSIPPLDIAQIARRKSENLQNSPSIRRSSNPAVSVPMVSVSVDITEMPMKEYIVKQKSAKKESSGNVKSENRELRFEHSPVQRRSSDGDSPSRQGSVQRRDSTRRRSKDSDTSNVGHV